MKKVQARKMKQIVMLMMVLVMLVPISVYGQAKTVEVKGYLWEGMTDEDFEELPAQFTVSNVIDTLDISDISDRLESDFGIDTAFITQSPTIITTLVGGSVFDVYKLSEKDDGTYEFFYGEEFLVSGQIKAALLDPSGELDEYGNPRYMVKTVDSLQLAHNVGIEPPYYFSGCTVALTDPGDYYVVFREEVVYGSAEAIIRVTDEEIETIKPEETVTALVTSSKVLVDGEDILFDAYNINGNNYFKLRDLAMVINGTTKQFGVTWDGEKNAINLVTGESYIEVGGELAKGDGEDKTGILNTAKIYKDGEEIQLVAYNINGNNYFKLRDVAETFNIGVTWDEETKTVGIDTSTDYIAE